MQEVVTCSEGNQSFCLRVVSVSSLTSHIDESSIHVDCNNVYPALTLVLLTLESENTDGISHYLSVSKRLFR